MKTKITQNKNGLMLKRFQRMSKEDFTCHFLSFPLEITKIVFKTFTTGLKSLKGVKRAQNRMRNHCRIGTELKNQT